MNQQFMGAPGTPNMNQQFMGAPGTPNMNQQFRGTAHTTTSTHSGMPTPNVGPMGYQRMTPQHGPGMHGHGGNSRKSRQELSQAQMKNLYNSIDKTTLPVMSTAQAQRDTQQSSNVTDSPGTPGVNGNNTPQQAGGGGAGYVPGTSADPFAQVAKDAVSGKMVPQHPPFSKPPTSMAAYHKQPMAANPDEGITFLEERKRYFSRQKQQAVFHYTLRHAKQYAKIIGMTIEWCFAHLEEKRKIDLANGIKNPIAELAQRTDLDEYTRKTEKARLEIIKKADEIDFLLRQKALESAMGLSGSGAMGSQLGSGSGDHMQSHASHMESHSALPGVHSAHPHSAHSGSGAPGLSQQPYSGTSNAGAFGYKQNMPSSGMAPQSYGSLPGSGQMVGHGYSYAETIPSADMGYQNQYM
jgi:hypothetical protein